jgi:hypothetical protein
MTTVVMMMVKAMLIPLLWTIRPPTAVAVLAPVVEVHAKEAPALRTLNRATVLGDEGQHQTWRRPRLSKCRASKMPEALYSGGAQN